MAGVRLANLVRSVRRPVSAAEVNTDSDLLARFVRDRDEAAFEVLVWRHGAAVLATCRRILRHEADAEDAFQAAFLMLARKARSIAHGKALPAWLHRVATRFALRIASTRRRSNLLTVDPVGTSGPSEIESRETLAVLDREIDRLPEKQRTAVLLVYLNGKTAAEAAQELGVPTGTVESRLAAARRILKSRLTERGVALLATLAPAALPPTAAAGTAHAATRFAHGGPVAAAILVGPSPVHLVREAIRMSRLRLVLTLSVLLSLSAFAAGSFLSSSAPVEDRAAPPPSASGEARGEPPADPRHAAEWWGEPLVLGTLGRSYSYFQSLSPDGKRMLVQHHGELLCVDIAGSKIVWSTDAKGLWNAVYSPDGRMIATAQWENGANLLDAETGKPIAVFIAAGGSGERPGQVGFLPNGNVVVHTSYSTYRILKDEPPLKDGSPKIASTFRYSLIVWDPKTKKEVRRTAEELNYGNSNQWQWMKGRSQILQTLHAWSENGVTVKQTLTHVDPQTGKKLPEIEIQKTDERAYDISPDGKLVLLGTGGESPRLIEVATGKVAMKLDGHRAFVTDGAWSPDGKLIATVSGTERPRSSYGVPPDGPSELLVRDAASGKIVSRYEYPPATHEFTKVGFSPDGNVIYAVTKQKRIVAWGRFAFERPSGSQRVGLPALPELPEAEPFTGRSLPGGSGIPSPLNPVPDTLAKLTESLPKSGRTTAGQIDALYTAALGRLPTPTEAKLLQGQLGEKPSAEKLKKVVDSLVATPEFLIHSRSLQKRSNPAPLSPFGPYPFGGP